MSSQKTHYVIAALVILVAAAIAVWYVLSQDGSAPTTPPAPVAQPEAPTVPSAAATTSSLGASLLEKAQNPIQDKVPELSPTANPVKDVYKNPFE
ncbi:MAG: hypothetical protein HYY10_00275 [Candidatus Liptonbacteria bacterium]|nr:hypothetical protein [Candidatus Liptonbacteria bacterium]